MLKFDGAHPALSHALEKRGYETLTPVQLEVLNTELLGRDLLVSAQTGSGKTVAFGLSLAPDLLGEAERFDRSGAPLALIVAPTRELALQVERELQWLYAPTNAVITSCVGGMDMRKERRTLAQGAHIVVGTPGRLRDHIDRGSLQLNDIKTVVLDEADEMLDLGFRDDLEYILETTPEDRRTLMFSATVPRTITNMAKRYQNDALRIATASEEKQHVDIEYRALMVNHRDVENGIINVLRYYDAKNTIVFCATRASVARMTSRFSNRGFSVVALSGELSQEQRSHALQAMRDGRAKVCIATDVAARGIDLPDLELVIHADLPTNKETLLHRSGRTGRAGRKGVSALMVPANLRGRAERLLRWANVDAAWANPPSADDILARDDERILADPLLVNPVDETETTFIEQLLATHSAEQIAAAFVRSHRNSKSAPEELMEISVKPARNQKGQGRGADRDFDAPPRGPRQTAEFENGKWISLSIGRNQKAEPRWLLPMLCKSSGLTKRNIGSIKIRNEETYVEISNDSFDGFLTAIGPNQTLEKSIRVTQIDGVPDFDHEQPPRERGRGNRDRDRGGEQRGRGPRGRGSRDGGSRDGEQRGGEKKWDKPKFSSEERRERRERSDKDAGRDGGRDSGRETGRDVAPKRRKDENRKNRDRALEELERGSSKSGNSSGDRDRKPKRDRSPKEQFANDSNFTNDSGSAPEQKGAKRVEDRASDKKPKKAKKNRTVKFTGLKKKEGRGKEAAGGSSGGMSGRKRPRSE
ncbi:MAG: DEAD/DEAH box helicase [Lentilitoribacter sp.]